ncbi:MAG: Asp-tRNA(Asn)/Glu-tRNA(Gln) amidotransferase subunit GatB [bacterium]|nr:Asp-tRNA(Asn)/Glu-tRNA(Gln) amidotransferase subunit GatB [bacterium]
MEYLPTIGLEVHAELKTRTKMFCDSANNPDEIRPNVNVCPICLAHPGTLPVINREAVRHVLRLGTALGGTIAHFSEFDRKSYFYPDIPKGYQISQYEHPLVSGGTLAGVAITRVHLEEDTARSTHAAGKTLVDFNRAGIPLMELVTEPVIPDAETAGAFARELQLLLRTLGAGEANLEKGEMRIEANISVAPKHQEPSAKNQTSTKLQMGTKVEIKNLNSFRNVERAIAYEIERQSALIESGGKVEQETRGWDEAKQQTFHQRFKEGSADYRYFPEPDLPSLSLAEIPEFGVEMLRASLPELPWVRRARYREQLGLQGDDIEYLLADPKRTAFFEAVVSELDGQSELAVSAANYLISDLAGEPGKATPVAFATLIRMFASSKLSSRGAKDVLALLSEEGGDPEAIAEMRGLVQVTDASALATVVDTILTREVAAIGQYRAGKTSALEYLVGQAMRESRSAGNPQTFRRLFEAKLG